MREIIRPSLFKEKLMKFIWVEMVDPVGRSDADVGNEIDFDNASFLSSRG